MRQVGIVLLSMAIASPFNEVQEEATQCPPEKRYSPDVALRAAAAREVLDEIDIDDDCAAEIKDWIVAETEPIIRHDLFEALVDRAEDADTDWLLSFLEDPDPSLRAQAAAFAEDELTSGLEHKLADLLPGEPYWWVRWRIVSTLHWADGDAVLDALNDALEDEAREVRENAAEALSSMPHERSLKALLQAMDQWPSDSTEDVLDALGAIGDARAVPALESGLGAIRDSVRLAAASALGSIDSRESIQLLKNLLSGADDMLALSASQALMRIGGEEAVESLAGFALVHPSETLVEWLGKKEGDSQAAACVPLLRRVELDSPASRKLTQICEELERREGEGIVGVTSSCSFGGSEIDYEVFSASARKTAPSEGAAAIAWLEFPGDAAGGTRVTLPADLIVTVEDALLQSGQTWLLVGDSSTETEYWIAETELRRITRDEWEEAIEMLRVAKHRRTGLP
jgi:HEAT repeat protein